VSPHLPPPSPLATVPPAPLPTPPPPPPSTPVPRPCPCLGPPNPATWPDWSLLFSPSSSEGRSVAVRARPKLPLPRSSAIVVAPYRRLGPALLPIGRCRRSLMLSTVKARPRPRMWTRQARAGPGRRRPCPPRLRRLRSPVGSWSMRPALRRPPVRRLWLMRVGRWSTVAGSSAGCICRCPPLRTVRCRQTW
jgi:hypothetical protein